MLNYAPDGMAGGFAPWCLQGCVAWEAGYSFDGKPLDSLISASRQILIRTYCPKHGSIRQARASFQPERMSGFCAAG
jgi:hypothetical protein